MTHTWQDVNTMVDSKAGGLAHSDGLRATCQDQSLRTPNKSTNLGLELKAGGLLLKKNYARNRRHMAMGQNPNRTPQ